MPDSKFRVLIADDNSAKRQELLKAFQKARPSIATDLVANPSQANVFFDQNRSQACNLCMVIDGDMSDQNFSGTTVALPENDDLMRTKYQHLIAHAKQWVKDTGSKVFVVRHSSGDRRQDTNFSSQLGDFQVNNFDNPFIWSKRSPEEAKDMIPEICSQCDQIFRA